MRELPFVRRPILTQSREAAKSAVLIAIALFTTGLVSDVLAQVRKPRMADTIKSNVYADNSFKLYINGELVAVDSIKFVRHNVISVDILP